MASAVDTQFLELKDVIKDKDNPSLHVINSSNPKGNITFEVADGMGGKTSILLPATWVDVDLTTQSPKESILTNPQFRKFVAAGFIKLCSSSYVKSLSAKEGYAKEQTKVYNAAAAAEEGFKGEVNKGADTAIKGEKVSGFVLNLVNSESVEESEAVNSVRMQEDTLTKEDLSYLVNECKFAKVKALAAEILNEKHGS
jgi:hypothetical protein